MDPVAMEESSGLLESRTLQLLPQEEETPRTSSGLTTKMGKETRIRFCGLTAKLVAASVAALLVVTMVALGRHGAGEASGEGVVDEKESAELFGTSHYDQSRVPCDILHLTVCDCTWASRGMCSRRNPPDYKCWDCCCRALHYDAYQNSEANRDYADSSTFIPGQKVGVRRHLIWRDATIIRRKSRSTYEVRYDLSRRKEIVPWDRIRDNGWPLYQIIIGIVLLVLVIAACLSVIGFLCGTFNRTPIPGEREEEWKRPEPIQAIDETISGEQKDGRSCGVCS